MMDELILIPYCKIGDEWSLSDEVMAGLWHQMVAERSWKTVFVQGKVTSCQGFLEHCQNPNNIVQTVWLRGRCILLSWLNNIGYQHAMGHFCGFRRGFGPLLKEAGELVLQYWFGLPDLYTIIGAIPEPNKLAQEYVVRKLGFEKAGAIPGMIHDAYKDRTVGAVFVYKTKEAHCHG